MSRLLCEARLVDVGRARDLKDHCGTAMETEGGRLWAGGEDVAPAWWAGGAPGDFPSHRARLHGSLLVQAEIDALEAHLIAYRRAAASPEGRPVAGASLARPVAPPARPEFISVDHHDPYLVNYRGAPIPLRLGTKEPDGRPSPDCAPLAMTRPGARGVRTAEALAAQRSPVEQRLAAGTMPECSVALPDRRRRRRRRPGAERLGHGRRAQPRARDAGARDLPGRALHGAADPGRPGGPAQLQPRRPRLPAQRRPALPAGDARPRRHRAARPRRLLRRGAPHPPRVLRELAGRQAARRRRGALLGRLLPGAGALRQPRGLHVFAGGRDLRAFRDARPAPGRHLRHGVPAPEPDVRARPGAGRRARRPPHRTPRGLGLSLQFRHARLALERRLGLRPHLRRTRRVRPLAAGKRRDRPAAREPRRDGDRSPAGRARRPGRRLRRLPAAARRSRLALRPRGRRRRPHRRRLAGRRHPLRRRPPRSRRPDARAAGARQVGAARDVRARRLGNAAAQRPAGGGQGRLRRPARALRRCG